MSADWGGQSAECCQTPVGIPKPKNLNPWGEAPEVGRAVTCIPKSSQTRLAHPPSCSLLLRPMDTQEGHSTALLGAETMDRRGVWVRKPMFEADWEDTSAWAAYREAVLDDVLERRMTY